VARFIGSPPMNTVTATINRVNETLVAEIPGGHIPLDPDLAHAVTASGVREVVIGVRPEDLRFDAADGIPALVSVVESLGHERHVVCRLDDQQLVIVRQDAHEPAPAEESSTYLVADPSAVHVFDPESGARVSP